jgi:antitoxin component of MazEF toxin-antitoxin module
MQPNNSLYVNVPKLAIDLLDFNNGEDVDVEIHDDRIVVRRGSEE